MEKNGNQDSSKALRALKDTVTFHEKLVKDVIFYRFIQKLPLGHGRLQDKSRHICTLKAEWELMSANANAEYVRMISAQGFIFKGHKNMLWNS